MFGPHYVGSAATQAVTSLAISRDVLVMYTWLGDTNLDGVVNAADLSNISASGTTWQTGDFNYDGKVNADDFSLYQLGDARQSGTLAAVPEPMAFLLALPALLALRRRGAM
jgi:hypothetical protein